MFGPSKYPGSNIGGSNSWSGNHLGIFTSETPKRKPKPVAPIYNELNDGRVRYQPDPNPDVDTFDYGPG